MKNRKFIAPAVAFGAIALALTACGGNPGTNGNTSSLKPGEESSDTSVTTSSSTSTSVDPSTAPIASGAQQFVNSSYKERTKILGKLEKYAVDHAIAGLPLYEDSGYQLFNPRVVRGTNTYITNFGFSTLRDGYLKGSLAGESNSKYQNYYHNWDASDPATINAWNDQGSQVSDLFDTIGTSYFGQRLNSDKTGYEWYGILSKQDHMFPVSEDGKTVITKNPTAEELHRTWRFYVRTGEAGKVTYRTASSRADRKAFDGRYVQLEDYITTYKMLLNGANALYRGTEMAKKTGKGAIAGVADYYAMTKAAGKQGVNNAVDFSGVGIKAGTDAEGDYLQITYQTPLNRFYAMYSCNGSLYEPMPEDFINLVGIKNLAGYSSDKSTSPVDNILSTGPYMLETWETDKLITFHRNDQWYERQENPNLYRIEGIHTDILPGYATDKNIAIKQFLNSSNLDACGVTSDYLEKYSSDPRAVQVPGTAVWKLNINSCTPELWEELFGEKGRITHTTKENYWNVKPWMSNDSFLRGLFYSIDRATYAKNQGGTPSINFFPDNYICDPENGVSYNSTAAHEEALQDFWGDTIETFGYDKALSQACFEEAIKELRTSGEITDSTEEIGIDVWWMYPNQIEGQGKLIGGYIKSSFDAAATALGYKVRLAVNHHAVAKWDDVYNKHLLVGQFDLGFGSITGNNLDPLNFLEILKSDGSTGFTLNWGADTSIVEDGEDALIYGGKKWSFDGLWDAADHGVVLNAEGQPLEPVEVVVSSVVPTTDSVTLKGTIEIQDFDGLVVDLADIFGTTTSDYSDYFEIYPDGSVTTEDISAVTWDEAGNFSFTVSGTLFANIKAAGGIPLFGVDFVQTIGGVYCGLKSAYASVKLPAPATPEA